LAETATPEAPPAAPPGRPSAPAAQPLPATQMVMAVALAWLVPGLGHVYLKRAARGLVFFVLVLIAVIVGCSLSGNLYRPVPEQWLTRLATFAEIGMGIPYFVLRYVFHYEGQLEAPGFEYGTAFLLTAGLMNLLLVLDVWDIGSGQKE
jgi:TM2 domain-containing membrane protein YozV